MKLSDFNLNPVTQDLSRWGITPHRENLNEQNGYQYPPAIRLVETGDTQLPISWVQRDNCLSGTFNTNEYEYRIDICPFSYRFQDIEYVCANVGFVVFASGRPTTELTPTQTPHQVFGTVVNGIREKVITLSVDAIVLVSTNNKESRTKLYNRLADLYSKSFGKVYKNIKTNTGIATIIISHRVPTEHQDDLYQFAIQQSESK